MLIAEALEPVVHDGRVHVDLRALQHQRYLPFGCLSSFVDSDLQIEFVEVAVRGPDPVRRSRNNEEARFLPFLFENRCVDYLRQTGELFVLVLDGIVAFLMFLECEVSPLHLDKNAILVILEIVFDLIGQDFLGLCTQ